MGVIALVAPLARRVKLKAMSRAWIILKLVPTARSVVDFIRLLASDRAAIMIDDHVLHRDRLDDTRRGRGRDNARHNKSRLY